MDGVTVEPMRRPNWPSSPAPGDCARDCARDCAPVKWSKSRSAPVCTRHPSQGYFPLNNTGGPDGYVGEDEQVTRKRIEAERIADDAREGVEGLPQVGSPGRQVNLGVGEEAQHWGNWARSSPIQPNSVPSRTRSFHLLAATISGQSHGEAPMAGLSGRLYRTSRATNPAGDERLISPTALRTGGWVPSNGMDRIRRATVSE